MVEDMAKNAGLPVVVVNPSTPIGPRDVKPTPTGRIIVEAACGRMPGFVDTGLNLVHVDDVAAGHLAALRRGNIGERYILGEENVYLSSMLAEIARVVGRRLPRLRIPISAVYRFALGAELWSHVSGREPFMTRDGLRMARHHMFFHDAGAILPTCHGHIRRPLPTRSPGSGMPDIWMTGELLVRNPNSRPMPHPHDVSGRRRMEQSRRRARLCSDNRAHNLRNCLV
jgi:dihydroflavonol-4-reductase